MGRRSEPNHNLTIDCNPTDCDINQPRDMPTMKKSVDYFADGQSFLFRSFGQLVAVILRQPFADVFLRLPHGRIYSLT